MLEDAVNGDKRLKSLIIGGLRRVWHRHPRRLAVLNAVKTVETVYNKDGTPSKKKAVFYSCKQCGGWSKSLATKDFPRAHVDHIDPVIPLKGSSSLTWDELIKRIFCDESNLQVLCSYCHTLKTKAENEIRRSNGD